MTTIRSIAVCSSLALSVFAACSRRPAAATPPSSSGPAAANLAPAVAHATVQPVGQTTGATVTGTVLETVDASNYTYVHVKTATGDVWAAASQFKVAKGERVTFSLDQPMEHFHSQALNRDFPLIYFVSQISREGEAPSTAEMPAGHPPVSGAGGASAGVMAPIEPPKDGTTIAALWKTRTSLAGRTVTVRGKVVKFTGGVLGVNWVHLQDGTGNAADGTHDITVTTDADARVGDVVTIAGTVALNKDLGSGYNYPIIIEHARIVGK